MTNSQLWEILVPVTMGHAEISIEYHRKWDKLVTSIAGGLTILAVARGIWVDKICSEEFCERMIPVRICCTDTQIHEIAAITAKHYNQRAIMFYRITSEVYIKRYDNFRNVG